MDADNKVCLILAEEHIFDGVTIPKGSLCVTDSNNLTQYVEEVTSRMLDDPNGGQLIIPRKILQVVPNNIMPYLLALKKTPANRLLILNDPYWMEDAIRLSVGDRVMLYRVPSLPNESMGVLKHKGPVEGVPGIYFGVLLDPDNHGKGTSDGTFRKQTYFKCEEDCAVFVSIYNVRSTHNQTYMSLLSDQITYPPHIYKSLNSFEDSNKVPQDQNEIKRPDKSSDVGSSISDGAADTLAIQYPPMNISNPREQPIYSNKTSDYVYNMPKPAVQPATSKVNFSDQKTTLKPSTSSSSSSVTIDLKGPEESQNKYEDLPIKIGDRVVWLSDNGEHPGTVKWVGLPGTLEADERSVTAGVELDQKVGKGTGTYNGKRLFTTKKDHAAIMPIAGLIKESDYVGSNIVPDNSFDDDLARAIEMSLKSQNLYESVNNTHDTSDSYGEGARPKTTFRNTKSFSSKKTFGFDIGSRVKVLGNKYGEIKWLGPNPKDPNKNLAGILMEDEDVNCYTNGTFLKKKLFDAPPYRAFFIHVVNCKPDDRKTTSKESTTSNGSKYKEKEQSQDLSFTGRMDLSHNCSEALEIKQDPSSLGSFASVPMLNDTMQFRKFLGEMKGIEGDSKLSGLVNMLFLWFHFNDCLDEAISRKRKEDDVAAYRRVQTILGKGVLHELRSSGFVPRETVEDLHNILSRSSQNSNVNKPSDYINVILRDILHIPSFLKFSNGSEANVIHFDKHTGLIDVKKAIGFFCMQEKTLFTYMPNILHITSQKGMLIPQHEIDFKPFIDGLIQDCIICGKPASVCCFDCYDESNEKEEVGAIYSCKQCSKKKHGNKKYKHHKAITMDVNDDTPTKLSMILCGIVCRKQEDHFICYSRCSKDQSPAWVKFDCMGAQHDNRTIPEVKQESMLPIWLEETQVMDSEFKEICTNAVLCLYVKQLD